MASWDKFVRAVPLGALPGGVESPTQLDYQTTVESPEVEHPATFNTAG